jgi:hypothetical protein
MPVENKVDPFKPKAPSIPGVPAAAAKTEIVEAPAPRSDPSPRIERPVARDARAKAIGIAVGIIVVLFAAAVLLRPTHNAPANSDLQPSSDATGADPPVATKSQPDEKLMIGPGPVATTAELAKPWSSRQFLFRGPFNADPVPAMVVRLPGGALWGFSLIEPFGQCQLQYVTDLNVLRTTYGFHAEHPMVVNPCTRAVYDLMRYGGGATDGGLVRGDIVEGSGVRPPMAIEIATQGRDIVAVRSE